MNKSKLANIALTLVFITVGLTACGKKDEPRVPTVEEQRARKVLAGRG